VRIFYFYLAALAEDPPATVAVSVILLSLLAGIWLLPRSKRFVDRRLAAHALRAETDAIDAPGTDTAEESGPDAEHLADVYDLRPPTGPPARHDHLRTPPTRPTATRRITSGLRRHKPRSRI
jgi:hypothetical protein